MNDLSGTTPAATSGGNSLYDRFMGFLARPVPISRGIISMWSVAVTVTLAIKVTYELVTQFDFVSLAILIAGVAFGTYLVVRDIRRQAKARTKYAAASPHPQVADVMYKTVLTALALWVVIR